MTSAAPVSEPDCINIRSNAAGTAIEVSYDGAAYVTLSGSGGGPAGTGTELQYRNGAVFGAVTGSSVSGANVALTGTLIAIDTISVFSNTTSQVNLDTAHASNASVLSLFRSRGVFGTRTAVLSGDNLGSIGWTGHIDSSGGQHAVASIQAEAQENFASFQWATDLLFFTSGSAELVRDIALRLTSDYRAGIGKNITHAAVTHTLTVAGTGKFTDQLQLTTTATLAGLNVGALAGNPSSLTNGDIWYNSTGNVLNARINGATVSLGAGTMTVAGTGTELQYRSSGTALAAVSGSSVSGSSVTLAGDATTTLTVQTFAAAASAIVAISRGRGTIASPTAVQSADSLGSLIWGGQYSSTIGQITTSATIRAEAQANFTALNDAPTDLLFTTKFNTTGTRIGLRVTSQQLVGIGDEITHSDVTHRLTVIGDVKLNLGSDATGDIWYRAVTTGTFTRLPIGSAGQVLTVASGLPSWAAAAGGGGSPGGSGTELQYRSGASTFGAVTGSSVSGGSVTLLDNFTVTGDAARTITLSTFAAAASSLMGLSRSRGTIASPTAVQSGDSLGSLIWGGQYSSTIGQITTSATIRAEAQANFTALNDGPTDLLFTTKFNTTGTRTGIRLTSQQRVGIGDEITHADVTDRLTVIGGAKFTMTTAETLELQNETVNALVGISTYGSAINSQLYFTRARGTIASPTAASGSGVDILGEIVFRGYYNTTNNAQAASIYAATAGAFTSSATAGGDLIFATRQGSGGLNTALKLTSTLNAVFGTAALATTATDAFVFLPSMAGTPTGAPSTYTGTQPIVIDTTAKKIWVNITGTGWMYVQLL